MHNTIIIGSGITGIACGQILHGRGIAPLILDKGRVLGGRIATRRVSLGETSISFDHGMQYFSPRHSEFREAIVSAGAVAWESALQNNCYVSPQGNTTVVGALACGLAIKQKIEVTHLSRQDDKWLLESTDGCFRAQRLVLTIPAPQALKLLGDADPLAKDLQRVEMNPCLTLMVAFAKLSERPFVIRHNIDHALEWIAQDSNKPERTTDVVTWVAQAGPEFSAAHIEKTPGEIVELMLPLFCEAVGVRPELALYAQVHRWRYAQARQPLGVAFLQDAARNLYIGGDWCLGAHAEDGWLSGQAIAHAIVEDTHGFNV